MSLGISNVEIEKFVENSNNNDFRKNFAGVFFFVITSIGS